MSVDKSSGLLFNPDCGEKAIVPFIVGSEPNQVSECAPVYYAPNDGNPSWGNDPLNNTNTELRRPTQPKNNSINWSDQQQDNTPIWEGISQ